MNDAAERDRAHALPRNVRVMTVVLVIITTLVGFGAAGEATSLVRGPVDVDTVLAERPEFGFDADPELVRILLSTHDAALAPLKTSRLGTLILLTFSCVLASVAGLRLLFPRGLSRSAMRQLLVGTTFCAAFLRTIDGAQSAAIFRRVAVVLARELSTRGQLGAFAELDPKEFAFALENLPTITLVAIGVITAAVTGLLLILAQYFRSASTREAIDAADVFGARG